MPVMIGGGLSDLRPFPSEEGDHIRVGGVSGHFVALPHAIPRFLPLMRGEGFRVIVDGPEIQSRAEAREIAGVRGGMGSLALVHGQADAEGVEGERGMHMQIAKEDLFLTRGSDYFPCGG